MRLLNSGGNSEEAFDPIGQLVADHSNEIFSKGYNFVSAQNWATPELAIVESLAGLRAFLDLPIEIYADESSGSARRRTAASCVERHPACCQESLPGSLRPVLATPLHQSSCSGLLSRGHQHFRCWKRLTSIALAKPLISIDLTLRPTADSSDAKPLEIAILSGATETVRHQVEQRVKLGYIACVTEKPASMYLGGKFVPKSVADIVVPIAAVSGRARSRAAPQGRTVPARNQNVNE